MSDEHQNLVERLLWEAIHHFGGDHLENYRARQQNRAPDVPQPQRTREHDYDVAMGRRPNRE